MMKQEIVPALTFFFPYHEVSGVPMLFSRMAVHLAGKGIDVRVVDYPDGPMADRVRGTPGVRLVPFSDGVPLTICDDSILVMQSILPATIRPELRIVPTTRLLFWTLHPANLIQTVIPLRFFTDLQMRSRYFHGMAMKTVMRGFATRLRAFVTELVRHRAIVFMDGENHRLICERLHLEIEDPIFVPVPSDSATVNRAELSARQPDGSISFGWLGRLADFKIYILLHILERLSRLARHTRQLIRFHIVGDGRHSHLIRRDRLEHQYFSVEMVGVLKGRELDDYLVDHIDVLAAMGTSALEGARLGLPTILLDFSYAPVPSGYSFRWLHDTRDYTLGEVIGPRHLKAGNDSLYEIVKAIRDDRAALSRRAFDYYRSNHAIDVVADRFLEAVVNSRFTYGDIDPELLRKGGIRRVYEWTRKRLRERDHRLKAGEGAC